VIWVAWGQGLLWGAESGIEDRSSLGSYPDLADSILPKIIFLAQVFDKTRAR
jgi:hypothetical protein